MAGVLKFIGQKDCPEGGKGGGGVWVSLEPSCYNMNDFMLLARQSCLPACFHGRCKAAADKQDQGLVAFVTLSSLRPQL